MKQVLSLFFLVLPCLCSAQNFNGVGKLKLGALEIDLISDLKNELGVGVTTVSEKKAKRYWEEWIHHQIESDKKPALYQLAYPAKGLPYWPTVLYSSITKELTDVRDTFRIFYLPKYTLGGISLKNVFLGFKMGVLELIEMDYSDDLVEAAKEKFPASVSIDSSYTIKCTYINSGVEKNELAYQNICVWEYPESKCSAISTLDRTSDCQASVVSYMRFYTAAFEDYRAGMLHRQRGLKLAKAEDKKNTIINAL